MINRFVFILFLTMMFAFQAEAETNESNHFDSLVIGKWKNYYDKALLQNGGRARIHDDASMEFIIPSAANKKLSSVQVWGTIDLDADKRYEIEFDSSVKIPSKIKVIYNMEGDPYTYFTDEMWVSLSDGENHIKREFKVFSKKNNVPCVIRFYLGEIDGPIQISNVKISPIN